MNLEEKRIMLQKSVDGAIANGAQIENYYQLSNNYYYYNGYVVLLK